MSSSTFVKKKKKTCYFMINLQNISLEWTVGETLLNITNDFPEAVVLEPTISWMWFLALDDKSDHKIRIEFNKERYK